MNYYYTERVEAFYMQKTHGFKFHTRLDLQNYYLDFECHEMLKPKAKDIILDDYNEPREVSRVRDNIVYWHQDDDYEIYCNCQDATIIYRNNKAFFTPISEEN